MKTNSPLIASVSPERPQSRRATGGRRAPEDYALPCRIWQRDSGVIRDRAPFRG
jgi:hypothetical protein